MLGVRPESPNKRAMLAALARELLRIRSDSARTLGMAT